MAIRTPLLVMLCLTLLAVQSQARESLRIAVAPDTGSIMTPMNPGPLIAYLGENLDVRVTPVPVVDVSTLIADMAAGRIDLAWMDSYALLRLRRLAPDSRALVQRPEDQQSRSLIVSTRDDVRSLADLRGKRMVFGSANSASGWLIPSALLQQEGIDPRHFFSRIAVAPQGDLAVRWLTRQQGDAAVLDQAHWQRLQRNPWRIGGLRVIASSEAYADRSWSVRGGLDISQVSALQRALLALDPQRLRHRQILRALEAERYVPAQPTPDPLVLQAERLIGRLK